MLHVEMFNRDVPPTIIYHANCPDGFTAAWAAHKALSSLWPADRVPQLVPGYYGTQPAWEDVKDQDVFIVDFSYPRDTLLAIFEAANTVSVYDHHKTAKEDLEPLIGKHVGLEIVFDMERSGAGITWDELCKGMARPWLVDYVEDRDLWRFDLPESKVINDYLMCVEHTFEAFDNVWKKTTRHVAAEHGRGARMKIDAYCRAMESNVRRLIVEGHHGVPVVNAPQVMISDLLHHLCKEDEARGYQAHLRPLFAVGFWLRHDGKWQHSLRSIGDFDVSTIAKKHGGGGHKNAAGFEADSPVW